MRGCGFPRLDRAVAEARSTFSLSHYLGMKDEPVLFGLCYRQSCALATLLGALVDSNAILSGGGTSLAV